MKLLNPETPIEKLDPAPEEYDFEATVLPAPNVENGADLLRLLEEELPNLLEAARRIAEGPSEGDRPEDAQTRVLVNALFHAETALLSAGYALREGKWPAWRLIEPQWISLADLVSTLRAWEEAEDASARGIAFWMRSLETAAERQRDAELKR